jgi:nucleoside-diphosphate-sugar epimerase
VRVFVTGGAGFIGGAVVRQLLARGDAVVAAVRNPAKPSAATIAGLGADLVRSDLSDTATLSHEVRGCEGLIHLAGDYRIGISLADRSAMWEANVGTTRRVLDAAVAAAVGRIVYVSTNNIHGDTHGRIVDETYRRNLGEGFLSWYDETKYRAHEEAELRIKAGAPIVIVQPGGVYGPGDHSYLGRQLQLAHAGRLRYSVFGEVGIALGHVDDVAAGILAALDRGRIGEAYSLSGECLRLRETVDAAARLGGHRPPRFQLPTVMLRAVAPFNDRVGGLPGMVPDLSEAIRATDGVTYWVGHGKASRELGFDPRSVERGLAAMFAAGPMVDEG